MYDKIRTYKIKEQKCHPHNSHTNITATYNDATNKVILAGQSGSGGGTDIGLLIALS